MKKTILGALLLLTIMGCSSQRAFQDSSKCVVCGRQTLWNSIGLCDKHYSQEKEQVLRGVIVNR